MKIYIYTTILIAIGCTIVYILISMPDTKAKIQRTLSSKLNNSAINLLQSDSDGNLSCIPAPLDGQQNYYLSGGGSWQKSLTQTYINARISIDLGSGISILKFTELTTSSICPVPFVLTNPTTFKSPNISGNYKIDIVLNSVSSVDLLKQCVITPVIGGVVQSTTISSLPVNGVPNSVSGVLILNIPANTILTFNLTNIWRINSEGTITIVGL